MALPLPPLLKKRFPSDRREGRGVPSHERQPEIIYHSLGMEVGKKETSHDRSCSGTLSTAQRARDHLCVRPHLCVTTLNGIRGKKTRVHRKVLEGDPFDKSRYLGGEEGYIRPVTLYPGNVLTRFLPVG